MADWDCVSLNENNTRLSLQIDVYTQYNTQENCRIIYKRDASRRYVQNAEKPRVK